ncbi:hypothetical protein L6164_028242 [Bauhinia variegata]|uniref:Uncharacterized protein n=1 Tax=Bauhinia variegata TaxID=167791 RepID=A0ACB9LVC9_BAUVA|nr:hypothetical protein L6164_028242 [Bauhinia variegata]
MEYVVELFGFLSPCLRGTDTLSFVSSSSIDVLELNIKAAFMLCLTPRRWFMIKNGIMPFSGDLDDAME